MNKSESIASLAAALVKAQAKIGVALKDKNNPFFKSKYADMSSVVEAIKGPVSENDLAYTQILHDADNAAKVETVILHSSGEWLSCGVISVPVSKHDAQGYGSAITYARRYSLSAAFGVVADDDDGNAAAAAAPKDVASQVAGAKVTPTSGLREQLQPEQLQKVERTASSVIDCFSDGDVGMAWKVITEANLDTDEKAALWTFFDSKMRRALKVEAESRKRPALVGDANHVATQA
jgi:hypothetical protein